MIYIYVSLNFNYSTLIFETLFLILLLILLYFEAHQIFKLLIFKILSNFLLQHPNNNP